MSTTTCKINQDFLNLEKNPHSWDVSVNDNRDTCNFALLLFLWFQRFRETGKVLFFNGMQLKEILTVLYLMNFSKIVKQPSEWNFGRAKSVNSLTACCEEWFEQLWDLCALLLSSSSLRYIKLTQCQNYSFNLFWLKTEIFSGSGELKHCKW